MFYLVINRTYQFYLSYLSFTINKNCTFAHPNQVIKQAE